MPCLIGRRSLATILVVDVSNNLQFAFQYIKDAVHKTVIARSSQRAIDTARTLQPDLILLDIEMSKSDGFSICRQLKNDDRTKNIPVIFISALAETEDKVQGLMLGAVDYITKPIAQKELLARINNHLNLHSLNQRLTREVARQKLLFKISDRIRKSLDLNLIVRTATEEIKPFLNCDFVGLVQLKRQQIELKAAACSEADCYSRSYFYSDFCRGEDELESYRQSQITSLKSVSAAQNLDLACNRLTAPIVIKQAEKPDVYGQVSSWESGKKMLWGWLIVDRYCPALPWQDQDTELLQELTTQIAIAIEQALLHQRIAQLAILDSLTKVHNRRYFDRQLELEWSRLRRFAAPLSLIMCDVDHFKIYNDTYGHHQGDLCLQQVAGAIAKVIKRSGDILARYGGEEFAIILPKINRPGAFQVAQTISTAIKQLAIPHVNSPTSSSIVSISIGVATVIPDAENKPYALVEAADQALYEAKDLGRDRIAAFELSHCLSY